MKVVVTREHVTDKSTTGSMYVDQAFQCFTLEPPPRVPPAKPRAIPAGTYPLTLRFSLKHGRVVPHVENVPGFSQIEIHIGNFPKDTLACTLVGLVRGVDSVGSSASAFEPLLAKMEKAAGPEDAHGVRKVGTITYIDPIKPAA